MDHRSFKELLEDLIQDAEAAAQPQWQPSAGLDYLSVADELLSGRIAVSSDEAFSEYELNWDAGDPAAADADAERAFLARPLDDEAIAGELQLTGADAEACSSARRRFALANHPDRVPAHLREHAMARMQVANRLIDAAISAAAHR
jgi:hypothetical protein